MDGSKTEIPRGRRRSRWRRTEAPLERDGIEGDSFVTRRIVRLAEVGHDGRMRVEAVGHWLQDVAHDHLEQRGLTGVGGWVLRRLELDISDLPHFDQRLEIATRCTESGPRCCDRVTTFSGCDGPVLSARAVWVCIDPATGRSRPLPFEFHDRFSVPAARRRLGTRLRHAPPPPPSSSPRRPWPTRAGDFDVYGHMNNAACCAPIDEVLARIDPMHSTRIEVEYRQPIQPDEVVTTAIEPSSDGIGVWLLVGDDVRISARISTPARSSV